MDLQGDPAQSANTDNSKRKEPQENGIKEEECKQMRLMDQNDFSPPFKHAFKGEPKKFVRQNHSEIEKRRRDKMNTYITELSSMVPTCVNMNRKMDKLTVLRLAVQHLKTIRGSLDNYTEAPHKPLILTDSELKKLILPSADGFIFVVDSARTRILYVSESVSDILNFSHKDLIGQSLFDILHPKDIEPVKEQLTNYDAPRERLIDSKTMLPLKGGEVPQSLSRLHPGARRVFFCRMKCKPGKLEVVKEENEISPDPMLNTGYNQTLSSSSLRNEDKRKKYAGGDKKYLSIQCTGYLKTCPLTKAEREDMADLVSETDTSISCFVAVGRLQPSLQQTIEDCVDRGKTQAHGVEFFSRHGVDGKYMYVDQRVTLLLGYLPQELVDTSLYEHIQYDDIPVIAECHRNTLKNPKETITPYYRFRSKGGKFVRLESKWKHFRNPWTKEIEFIVCKNYLLFSHEKPVVDGGGSFTESADMEFFSSGRDTAATAGGSCAVARDIQRVISSHAEATKIGQHIADEVIENWRAEFDSSASNSPLTSLQAVASPASLMPSTSNSGTPNLPQKNNKGTGSPGNGARIQKQTNQRRLPSNQSTSGFSGMGGVSDSARRRGSGTGVIVRSEGSGHRTGNLQDNASDQGSMNVPPTSPSQSSESGNDEAATAVLMSLLEAEGGLGGPFDFGNLPWPLP